MNNKKLRFLSGTFAVILMLIIFCFSAQTGSASDVTSISLTELFFSGDLSFLLFLNVIIRKVAHMAEYAALAVPCWLFLSTFDLKKPLGNILSFAFSAFYAATDEIHQLFVPGRSGQIKDVFIDSVGALLGIVFINIVILLIHRHKRKNTEDSIRSNGTMI